MLHGHRREIGTRAGRRAGTVRTQAKLVLRWFRDDAPIRLLCALCCRGPAVAGGAGADAGRGDPTRRQAPAAEPVDTQVPRQAKSTSRSAISRRFVRQTETALAELMSRDLSELDIKVLVIERDHLAERYVDHHQRHQR